MTEYLITRLGIEIPDLERIVATVWWLIPFLAALATLYLYHVIWTTTRDQPVAGQLDAGSRPSWIERQKARARVAFSIIFLVVFVGGTLYANYSTVTPDYTALKYKEVYRLSDYSLRERAFQVAAKVDDLNLRYRRRADEILRGYTARLEAWKRETDAYQKAKTDYDEWHRANDPYSYNPLQLRPYSLLGSQSPSPPDNSPEPSKPTPPGSRPEPDRITVDGDWARDAVSVQEEAAAVWEEISRRRGFHPQMFDIPKYYQFDADLSAQSQRLISAANTLSVLK